MKTRNIFTVVAFILAIGSAFASSRLSVPAYTSKANLPSQQDNCEERGTCTGTGAPCVIIVNEAPVPLFDGETTQTQMCGVQLNGQHSD